MVTSRPPFADKRVVVVAAHPDDETIGCGALLGEMSETRIVYLTDGVPRDQSLVPDHFRGDAEAYRTVRAGERRAALALVGLGDENVATLGATDQEATYALEELALRLLAIVEQTLPTVIVAHPYEGGHPDHDAAAFAARAVCSLQRRRRGWGTPLWEMTSYHGVGGRLVTGRFLDALGTRRQERCETFTWSLSDDQRSRKANMMRCFESQRQVLAPFGIETERFRPAPPYDFLRAPHDGELYYEHLGWHLTGARWRALAAKAQRNLHSAS
jgi:LmbE family N-acetylglucosaminyl deacetylase